MKLIDLYKEWMETGEIPSMGLCKSIPIEYKPMLEMIAPSDIEVKALQAAGLAFGYWGYEGKANEDNSNRLQGFTPLRQTIVLLICAMCDEL